MKQKPLLYILFLFALNNSTIESTNLTLYNDGTGYVNQTIKTELPIGEFVDWKLDNLAASLEATSVRLFSASNDSFKIHEQNFEYDLVNKSKILEKYLGKEIKFAITNISTGRITNKKGLLLSNIGEGVYKIDNEIYIGAPGRIILPDLPDGLAIKPSLKWKISNSKKTKQDLHLSYLMSGTPWSSDYSLNVNDGSFVGWVTLNNNSGTSFTDSNISLVAGEINRAKQPVENLRMQKVYTEADSVQSESLFEYHMYTLPNKTDLPDKSIKQVKFVSSSNIELQRKYTIENHGYSYQSVNKIPVKVSVEFLNSDKNGLGIPLPKGLIRMFATDSNGNNQFVGEDRVSHTPKNEKISLNAGEAFDIVSDFKELSTRNLEGKKTEKKYQLSIRNRKDTIVTVSYKARLWGDVQIKPSDMFKNIGNNWYESKININPNQEITLDYTVVFNN